MQFCSVIFLTFILIALSVSRFPSQKYFTKDFDISLTQLSLLTNKLTHTPGVPLECHGVLPVQSGSKTITTYFQILYTHQLLTTHWH